MKTVKEVSRLTGISVRALHHYDATGLLKPTATSEAGYRLYDDTALSRLQSILFYRELGFKLAEIKEILDSPRFDAKEALLGQLKLLTAQRQRLDGIISLAKKLLRGDIKMSFSEFDMSKIEETRSRYADETRERWGNTPAYAQSQRRTNAYKEEDWRRISAQAEAIYRQFALCMNEGANSEKAKNAVDAWQNHISDNFYECSDEILKGLADMYENDQRFTASINEHGDGLASFMAAAIRAHR